MHYRCLHALYCRGSAQREHRLCETQDELYELHTTFSVNHHIIICGDMNAFLDTRCSRNNLFQNCIRNTGLIITGRFPRNPTDYHLNGVDVSSIDCIITTANILDVDILDLSVNTSPHNQVILNTSIELSSITQKHLPISPVKKHMWYKGNLDAYKQYIYINQSCVQPTSLADIDLSLNTITTLLSHAGIANIPLRGVQKKRILQLSPAIPQSHHHHREALLAWIAEGRPTLPAATAVTQKQTKTPLRSQCRREEAARCEAFFNRIHDAWPRDSKTFYDMIQWESLGRYHHRSNLRLRIAGHLNSDLQNVLAEWTRQFFLTC